MHHYWECWRNYAVRILAPATALRNSSLVSRRIASLIRASISAASAAVVHAEVSNIDQRKQYRNAQESRLVRCDRGWKSQSESHH